jgi:hypothetical protein
MFNAATGVTEMLVLRPNGMLLTPAMIPILGFQLYSIAGANPNEWLAPERSWNSDASTPSLLE